MTPRTESAVAKKGGDDGDESPEGKSTGNKARLEEQPVEENGAEPDYTGGGDHFVQDVDAEKPGAGGDAEEGAGGVARDDETHFEDAPASEVKNCRRKAKPRVRDTGCGAFMRSVFLAWRGEC